MISTNVLMAIKVLILVAGGAAFVWWQWQDLAQERRKTQAHERKDNSQQGQTDS